MPPAGTLDPAAALASRRILIAQRRLQLAADLHVITRPLARVDEAVALWRALPPVTRGASVALAACAFRRLRGRPSSSSGWLALLLAQLRP
jgi:hypothetical protein